MNVELIGNPDLTRKWYMWFSKSKVGAAPWRWYLNRHYWRGIEYYFDGWCDG